MICQKLVLIICTMLTTADRKMANSVPREDAMMRSTPLYPANCEKKLCPATSRRRATPTPVSRENLKRMTFLTVITMNAFTYRMRMAGTSVRRETSSAEMGANSAERWPLM